MTERISKKERDGWPADLQRAGELLMHMLRTAQRVSFQQSKALQDLLVQRRADFDDRLRAWKSLVG